MPPPEDLCKLKSLSKVDATYLDKHGLPEPFMATKQTVLVPYVVTFPPSPEHAFHPSFDVQWLLNPPKLFVQVLQLRLRYDSVEERQLITPVTDLVKWDLQWIQDSSIYISQLPLKDKFTLYGYTHNGDEMTKFLLTDPAQLKTYLQKILPRFERPSSAYFPLYFFAKELILGLDTKELLNKYLNKYVSSPTPTEIQEIKNQLSSLSEDKQYVFFQSKMHLWNLEFWEESTRLFVEDLQRIILAGPVNTKPCVVYRGVQDRYFKPNDKTNIFVHDSFMSTSIDTGVAQEHMSKSCCLKKILLNPGQHGLWMEGITQHNFELEILLPRNLSFQVLSDVSKTVVIPGSDDYKYKDKYMEFMCNTKLQKIPTEIIEMQAVEVVTTDQSVRRAKRLRKE
jgi:hypothetical protein